MNRAVDRGLMPEDHIIWLENPAGTALGEPARRDLTEPSSSAVGQDQVVHERVDLRLPPAAVEHAVVADAGLQVVALAHGPDVAAQIVGGERLAR